MSNTANLRSRDGETDGCLCYSNKGRGISGDNVVKITQAVTSTIIVVTLVWLNIQIAGIDETIKPIDYLKFNRFSDDVLIDEISPKSVHYHHYYRNNQSLCSASNSLLKMYRDNNETLYVTINNRVLINFSKEDANEINVWFETCPPLNWLKRKEQRCHYNRSLVLNCEFYISLRDHFHMCFDQMFNFHHLVLFGIVFGNTESLLMSSLLYNNTNV